MYLEFFFTLTVLAIIIKIYTAHKSKWCTSKICLNGKTVIVTGSNTGIGYATALDFAMRGAKVILACRDLIKAAEARDKIVAATENNNVIVKELNLSSLHSVRDFVKDIKANEKRIDILVNNAGCGAIKHKMTEDGLEMLMQINYFSPFLLTILLLDILKKSGFSRIINVSSVMAKRANLTVENLNKWPGSHLKIYNNSKLANILFTIKLSALLKGSNLTTYSVHPGAIITNLFRNIKGWQKTVLHFFMVFYFKTPEEGAQTIIFTALEKGIEEYSGQHFEQCQKILPYDTAKDPKLVDEIWEETIKLLNCEKEVDEVFA